MFAELERCSAADLFSLSSPLHTGLDDRCLKQSSEHVPRGCCLSWVLFQAQWSRLKESCRIQQALSQVLNLQAHVWRVQADAFSYTQKLLMQNSLQKARGHFCTDQAPPLHLMSQSSVVPARHVCPVKGLRGFYSELIGHLYPITMEED